LTFFFGLFVLFLFAWYFLTDKEKTKRWLGTTLTLLLCAFSIDAFLPFEQKIHLGLDLQGGTSFLIRLVPPVPEEGGAPRAITPEMQEQAVEVIRKRVDEFGVSEPVITKQGPDPGTEHGAGRNGAATTPTCCQTGVPPGSPEQRTAGQTDWGRDSFYAPRLRSSYLD
jgi:preprotein translocase subunit SecD